MSGSNRETLRSYEARVEDYIAGTSPEVAGAARQWIDASLAGLSPESCIIELGSAFGRDAGYMASRGFEVECTDAVAGFVAELRARSFKARQFNALTDELDDKYDLILANAVLLHFTRSEFTFVLKKLFGSLKSEGRFAFSLKRGRGETWSHEKIGAPRYFCFWEPEELASVLRDAGFVHWTIEEAHSTRAHADWLYVIALAPGQR